MSGDSDISLIAMVANRTLGLKMRPVMSSACTSHVYLSLQILLSHSNPYCFLVIFSSTVRCTERNKSAVISCDLIFISSLD